MLRLAARMRSRPGMLMPAVLASRRLGMRGMRFATHGALAGMSFGGAPLFYLATARQPLQLQYRLNWQGRIQVMRDLSALLVERILHTRVMNLVERLLFGRLAPALRLGHGRSVSPRSLVERLRRQRDGRAATSLATPRVASVPNLVFMSSDSTREPGQAVEHSHRGRSAQLRFIWPAARPGHGISAQVMPEPNVQINASRILFRHVLETLRLFRGSALDTARHAAYPGEGSADAAGPMLTRYPLMPTILALRAAASPRFSFGIRGSEIMLRWLRTSDPRRGPGSGFGSALVRYLQTRVATAAQLAKHSSLARVARVTRGIESSPPLARMAFPAGRQTSRENRSSNVASAWIMSAKAAIGSRPLLALFRSAHAPGKSVSTLINSFISRLSRVFRQDTRWRPQTSGFMRESPSASFADVQETASVPSLLLQLVRKGSDSALPRAAGFARSNSPSRRQRLSLASRLVSRHEHRATVSLVQGYEPMLATAYGQGLPPPVMAYRETPRPPELQWSKQVQRIEQQITRNIVHNITQAMPWRGDMEKAVLTPRVMRELAEQVGGMMTQRIGLERYRRGL